MGCLACLDAATTTSYGGPVKTQFHRLPIVIDVSVIIFLNILWWWSMPPRWFFYWYLLPDLRQSIIAWNSRATNGKKRFQYCANRKTGRRLISSDKLSRVLSELCSNKHTPMLIYNFLFARGTEMLAAFSLVLRPLSYMDHS